MNTNIIGVEQDDDDDDDGSNIKNGHTEKKCGQLIIWCWYWYVFFSCSFSFASKIVNRVCQFIYFPGHIY